MPQESIVLQCYECNMFQVQLSKKSNKWECCVCGKRQSIKTIHLRGPGAECRSYVQHLNMKQGQMDNCDLEEDDDVDDDLAFYCSPDMNGNDDDDGLLHYGFEANPANESDIVGYTFDYQNNINTSNNDNNSDKTDKSIISGDDCQPVASSSGSNSPCPSKTVKARTASQIEADGDGDYEYFVRSTDVEQKSKKSKWDQFDDELP